MFRKLLIANRGEIAVRIAQACAETGITSVAVYSDADALSPHVLAADESYHIGPPPALESYLNAGRIIEVARRAGAEAVHPGYGFLAENAAFARACRDAGLAFVGPGPEAMRLLGSKQAAKRLARSLGVPVVPGYDGEQQDDRTLIAKAHEIGFPLLIKASGGGGGKGMRLVRDEAELSEALHGARREAIAAFGDGALLLERYVEHPRHVEIQVLADHHSNVVHLGERDCTIQRRHQKVIEESPSPAVTPDLREEMGRCAKRLAREAGYSNAGTVEFLLAPDGSFYFLEVNTRLQVEHPVTEMVTGLDLVREQLRIAAGERLAISQEDVRLEGHAIECRVYAEDPANQHLPSTGRLLLFEPPVGVGIRNDVGVGTGDEVTPYYDPMLAKLIITAPERASCVERALWALERYVVLGVATNLPLLRAVLASEDFRSCRTSTRYLDEHPEVLDAELASHDRHLPDAVLAAAAWRLATERAGTRDPWRAPAWLGADEVLRLGHDGRELCVGARREAGGAWTLSLDGEERHIRPERLGQSRVSWREGDTVRSARVVEADGRLHVSVAGRSYRLDPPSPPGSDSVGGPGAAAPGHSSLTAPMPGKVVRVSVREGDEVETGQTLVVLEAMKMEHALVSPRHGVVVRLPFGEGDSVQAGDLVAEVE